MATMETTALRQDEKIGLAIALALHLALAGVLLFQPGPGEGLEVPERMTVSLTTEVGLQSTAQQIAPDSRAALAPTVAEEVQAPVEASPDSAQRPNREPPPPPRTNARNAVAQPQRPAAQTPPRQATGTQVGENFLDGVGSSRTSNDTRLPADHIGASAQASLRQAINRQLKPHWNAPQGVDVEQLVTILAFRLNEDGSLAGRPRLVRQLGINDANRAQASLHAERAIRAVQLAAPFDLPPEYYNAWKNIAEWRFDRRL